MGTKRLVVALCCLLSSVLAFCQDVKRPESYNYTRGVEAIQKEQYQEALEYLNKEVAENPKNGYAFVWIAVVRDLGGEYGRALTAVDLALKNLPKKDGDYIAFAYGARAGVYLHMEDTTKALSDYAAAIKFNPKEEDWYKQRAQIYYEQEKYDLSDADYRKMIELNAGETMGYMGLGRNANAQEKWDEAIKQFDYVTKLASDYSSGYSFRAEAYIQKQNWNAATDDIATALSIDWDRKALYMAQVMEEPAFTMMVSKLKIQSAKSPNEATWPYIIGTMYEEKEQYGKAIEYYNAANGKDLSPVICQRLSVCQYELGNYEAALSSIDQALNMDSTDVSYKTRRANILYEMGDVKSAIAEWDKVLRERPEYGFGYYRRGWYKELAGDLDGAVEDLSMSIVLNPDDSYPYASRGDIYMKQGKKELAEMDFKKVIEIENSPENYVCIHYAYQGLGMYDKAIAAIDEVIAQEPTNAGNYYDAACLYSRMKEKDNALKYLEKSLELGYKRFAHIERDFDMDYIRDTDEYKDLLKRYKEKSAVAGGLSDNSNSNKEMITSEIPFTKEDGVCKVKCQINGLPLHFVFDTGASDVSLSMVEATFMMKNGYLNKNDVVGNQSYIDANGDVSVGTVINLKNVKFGDLELNNVRASVVRNQKAPLLLGQSVLGRLGKIEIDNGNRVLKITHQK